MGASTTCAADLKPLPFKAAPFLPSKVGCKKDVVLISGLWQVKTCEVHLPGQESLGNLVEGKAVSAETTSQACNRRPIGPIDPSLAGWDGCFGDFLQTLAEEDPILDRIGRRLDQWGTKHAT